MMDFVSALRRIAEVIELEKASGGAVERLRPTAGEELRVPAKPGGFSPSPTSSGQLEEPRPDPLTARLPVQAPRREAGEPAGRGVGRPRPDRGVRFDGAKNAWSGCNRSRMRS